MMMVIASLAVGLACFIIYALDRRSKQESIDWAQAAKITLFGGILTSGVVFATTSEIPDLTAVSETAKNVAETVAQTTEDMFVGSPTF